MTTPVIVKKEKFLANGTNVERKKAGAHDKKLVFDLTSEEEASWETKISRLITLV